MDPTTSSRSSGLPVDPTTAWAAVADARADAWYVDALPLRFRAALDRLVGGAPLDPPPGRRLRGGDRVGFWHVLSAADRTLVLRARVRAPGSVQLTTTVLPLAGGGCELGQSVSFRPRGLLGAAYLLADLPARELVIELVHRRTCTEVRRAAAPS